MARFTHDPALIALFDKGFGQHVEGKDSYAELDGAAFAEDLAAAGWGAAWAVAADDDEEIDVADAVSTAWAECAEPYGEEDDDGEQQVSADPREVLDNLARVGVTFARVPA